MARNAFNQGKGNAKYCDTRFLDLLNKIQVTIVSHSFNNVIPKNVVIGQINTSLPSSK
jgi:hypothetical protein